MYTIVCLRKISMSGCVSYVCLCTHCGNVTIRPILEVVYYLIYGHRFVLPFFDRGESSAFQQNCRGGCVEGRRGHTELMAVTVGEATGDTLYIAPVNCHLYSSGLQWEAMENADRPPGTSSAANTFPPAHIKMSNVCSQWRNILSPRPGWQ